MSSSRCLSLEQHHHLLSPIYSTIGPPSFPSCTGSFAQMECTLECLLTEMCAHRETTRRLSTNAGRRRMIIDMLPDVALLEIFDFYVNQAREEENYEERWHTIHAWHTLVHVCQKWRATVLGSPHRLDLRLFCKGTTPVRETLAVWPPLPIIIGQHELLPEQPMDNIIVALEHNDRVCGIDLSFYSNSDLGEFLAAMQQPFPALTHLGILLWDRDEIGREVEDEVDETPPVDPETFLGGSAPRLQHLTLERIPFPGLPKLLSSATDLVSLALNDIPDSGYISPGAMVRCLSALTRLERLSLEFKSPLSRPVRRPHPPTRSILPALTSFRFRGVNEYLEDLAARVDAPLLDTFDITYFHQLIFDTPQLAQFLARSPYTQPPVEARIFFSFREVEVTSPRILPRRFSLGIRCGQPDWQLSCLAQVCSSSFPNPFIPTVEHLYIYGNKYSHWQGDIEDSQWLEVLRPFMAVKYLYLSPEFTSRIAPALQELAGEVLTSLQNIFLEGLDPSGLVQGAIGKFVAARQLIGPPIAVSHWDGKPDYWEEVDD